MKIQTRENRMKSPPEVNGGPILVETAGYISKEKRIAALMLAGERLVQARKEMYDIPEGVDVDEDLVDIDPTRSGNYDLADASQAKMSLVSKSKQILKDEAKRLAEAKKMASQVKPEETPEKKS